MKDICCIGHLTRDKIITPESTVYMAGGTSFYFAHAQNHLPQGKVDFQLVTKVGEESMAEIEKMRQEGIDVQGYLREVRGESVHACQWKEKEQVLAMTDILKLNEYEMQVITDSSDPRTVATKLAQMGVREVVLTFGDYGSLICADGQFYEIPAYKPQHLVDATGCGDTYSAGYLYCRAQGESPLESGKFAAAMCTLKLEQHGPFSRSIDEIRYIMTR